MPKLTETTDTTMPVSSLRMDRISASVMWSPDPQLFLDGSL